jgi:CRISPR/Cas system-associated protein Cas5 (RAMP superfamily)
MVSAESYKVVGNNFDEIVKFVKEHKENNKMVFLYEIFYNPGRTEDTVIETENSKQTFLKSVDFFRLRYGVVND